MIIPWKEKEKKKKEDMKNVDFNISLYILLIAELLLLVDIIMWQLTRRFSLFVCLIIFLIYLF